MNNQTFVTRLNTIKKLNFDNSSFINKDLYRLVISQLALTNGHNLPTNNKTVSLPTSKDQEVFSQLQLVKSLLDESYQPKPFKEEDKKEAIIKEDKAVQSAVSTVLEAIYEPIFSAQSFGLRPNKNEHNLLKDIESKYDGLSYAIKGEIESIYNNVDHHILVTLLCKKISDSRFISLIWKLLRAGHINKKGFYASKLGIYKDSVLSPLLLNIYLHELDMFIAQQQLGNSKTNRSKTLTSIAKQYKNQKKVLKNKANKLNEGLEKDLTLKQLKATKLKSIQCRTYVDPCDRLCYHRYADHFILGIAGSKEYALVIQELVNIKLKELSLFLKTEETKIVSLRKDKVNFLGYNIYIDTSTKISKLCFKGKSPLLKGTTGWFVRLEAPIQEIVKRIAVKGFCNKDGFPTPNRGWSAMPDYQIVKLYNITFDGILTYYSGACHRHALGRLLYIFKYSCAMTLASKHRSSISKIFKKHGKQLLVLYGSRGEKQICFKEAKQFKEKDKVWKIGRKLPDPYRKIHRRLTKTGIFESCSNCDSKDNLEILTKIER